MRARVAEVNERVARMTTDLDDISSNIKAVSVTATSGDDLIRATVGHDGVLTSLELHRDVYDHYDPAELAREIEQTIAAAAKEARQRVMAACRPFVTDEQLQAALNHDYRTLVRGFSEGAR